AVARLGRAGAAIGGQRAYVRELAAHGFPLGVVPRRPDDLHPVVLGGGGAAVMGARYVLRLAVSVRCAAGADEPGGAGVEGAAAEGAVGRASAAAADEIHHLPRPLRRVAGLARVGRALVGDRAVQDGDRAALRARVVVRRV